MPKSTKFIEDRDDFPLWSLPPNLASADVETSMPAIAVPLTVPVTITTALPPSVVIEQPAAKANIAPQVISTPNNARLTGFTFDGISMSVYSTKGYENPTYQDLLVNAKNVGFNSLVLSNIVLIDLNTNKIGDMINGPAWWQNLTAPFSQMGPAIQSAQAQGFQVFLKPQLAAYDPYFKQNMNLCNADLLIPDPKGFFAAYKTYILDWAKLAEQYKVPLLSLGNEMVAVTQPQYTEYWYDIIDSVRQVYHGKLTYSSLINSSTGRWNESINIKFWDKLDYIGIDIYPDFKGITFSNSTASVEQFNDAWKTLDTVDMIKNLVSTYGKKVIFTETGISSFSGSGAGGLSDSLIRDEKSITDYQHQANWYQSFFETWSGKNRPDWLDGMFFWNNNPDNAVDLTDKGYTNNYDIYGKTAEKVVSSFLLDPNAKPVSQPVESVQIDDLINGFDAAYLASLLANMSQSNSIF